jgi:hypothetical protein
VANGNLLSIETLRGAGGETVVIVDVNGGIWADGIGNFYDAGIRTHHSEDNVSSPPTDAEIDGAFGTPAAVGEGFIGLIDDNNANTTAWIVVSLGGSWWYPPTLTKAV